MTTLLRIHYFDSILREILSIDEYPNSKDSVFRNATNAVNIYKKSIT